MDLTIFPYDFVAADYKDNLNIHIWGLNRNSESTLLRIDNFPAFCYLELPGDKNGMKIELNLF